MKLSRRLVPAAWVKCIESWREFHFFWRDVRPGSASSQLTVAILSVAISTADSKRFAHSNGGIQVRDALNKGTLFNFLFLSVMPRKSI